MAHYDDDQDEVSALRLMDDYDMAKAGWAAWSRNARGHLCTSHAPFANEGEWKDYVIEETKRGLRVFYPSGPLKMEEGRG